MSRQDRLLSKEEEADLKRLMEEYNDALRNLSVLSIGAMFSLMIVGRRLGQMAYDAHPLICLLLVLSIIVFGILIIRFEKKKRQRNNVRLPAEIKREIRRKYNINLEQARAAFAKTYGPTVLDSLAADNRKRGRSLF